MRKGYRQVVADKQITSSKSFNDFLYGWLVLRAKEENDERVIWKKDFVYSQFEEELNMTRKTIAKYFNWLVDKGLVIDVGDKWVIRDLGEKGFWIEDNVLERLISLKKRYVISVYAYLVRGYWISNKKRFVVLLRNAKEFVGIGVNSDSNNYLVTDCFEEFREMGLMNCQLWFDRESGKRFYCVDGVGRNNYF